MKFQQQFVNSRKNCYRGREKRRMWSYMQVIAS